MKRLPSLLIVLTAIITHAAPEPKIGAVLLHEGAHEISVIYSEPVDVSSLGNPDNYTVNGGGVISLRLAATNQGVILRVSQMPADSQGVVSISGVTDLSGTNLPRASLEFKTPDLFWAEIGANELGFRSEAVGIPEDGLDLFSGAIQQKQGYDEATFVGEQVIGDFDVKVRVEYVEPAGAGAKAGLMIREQMDEGKARPLDPDDPGQAFSRYAELALAAPSSVLGEANNRHQIWQRATTQSSTTASLAVTNDAGPAFPNAWLRIERIGQEFKMYRGLDGENWEQIGGATFSPDFSTNVYVGVAFSAHNDDIPPATELRKSFVAKFREYELSTSTSTNEVQIGRIHIQRISDQQAEVTWDSGSTLQTAANVTGDWTDVTGATSPYRVNFTEPRRFYRLKR